MAPRNFFVSAAAVLAVTVNVTSALAAGTVESGGRQPLNIAAIVMFFGFVAMTLGITYWAARRTRVVECR
jgi:cation/acetate symporter